MPGEQGSLRLTGHRVVDVRDPYIAGHFPGCAVYPGVFVIESVYQTAVRALGEGDGAGPSMSCVRSARFTAPLLAGDTMTIEAVLTRTGDTGSCTVDAICHRHDGATAATVKLVLAPRGGGGAEADGGGDVLDHAGVRRLLPQGHPMLLVDRIESLEPGRSIVGIKAISGCEPCYADRPDELAGDRHAYPATLLLESFGQTAAVLWLSGVGVDLAAEERVPMFVAARGCRVEGSAFPGDVVRHFARIEQRSGDAVYVAGESLAGTRRLLTVESMMAVLRPRASLATAAAAPAGTI